MSLKTPAFQFYPKDWLEFKVLRMSDAAQGVYMRLLCHIWIGTENQYSIKNNDKFIARCLGLSVQKWKKYKAEIQHSDASMFLEKDGYLISKRLKEEHEKQSLRRQQTQEASRIRWGMSDNQVDNQTDMQVVCPSSSSSSSSTSSKKILPNGNKVKVKKARDPNVQLMWDYAVSKDFSMQGSERSNRRWIYNLLRKKDAAGVRLSVEILRQMVDMAVALRGVAYAPQINDFRALYYKFQDLYAFMQKQQSGGRIG